MIKFALRILVAAVLQLLFLPALLLRKTSLENTHDMVLVILRKLSLLGKIETPGSAVATGYQALQFWATGEYQRWLNMLGSTSYYEDGVCFETVRRSASKEEAAQIDEAVVLMALAERLVHKHGLFAAGRMAEQALLGGIYSKEGHEIPYKLSTSLYPSASLLCTCAWFEVAKASLQRSMTWLYWLFTVLLYPSIWLLSKPYVKLCETSCCRSLFAITVSYRLSGKKKYYDLMHCLIEKDWYAKPIAIVLWKLYFAEDKVSDKDKLSMIFGN